MHRRASGVVSTWMRSAATTAHSRPASSSARRSLAHRSGQVGSGAVDGLGDVAQVLLGVVDINDLDGAGKVLGGQVPDHMLRATYDLLD